MRTASGFFCVAFRTMQKSALRKKTEVFSQKRKKFMQKYKKLKDCCNMMVYNYGMNPYAMHKIRI